VTAPPRGVTAPDGERVDTPRGVSCNGASAPDPHETPALPAWLLTETPTLPGPLPDRIGKYEVIDILGHGAMGVVYRAFDGLLERELALKVMLPRVAGDPDQKARFEREARAAAKIVHRNVLTVFDLGYHHDGSPYIAMELLQGRDLLQVMRHGPALTLDEKLTVVVQVLDGLAHAHHAGVVHRDIKPANLFLTDDGTMKIMDFGVARFTMSAATNEGGAMGSPDYMSPEQVQGQKVDARTDLWSVGCVLHELLTDARPFASDTLMTIFYKILHEDPAPELPPGPQFDPLRAVVQRALTRDLGERYQSARDFSGDLRAYLGVPQVAVAPEAAARSPRRAPETPAPALDLMEALAAEKAAASAVPVVPVAPAPPAPPPRAARERPADPTPLFALMRDIYVASRSGHLHFTHARQRRSLFFLRGSILHGTSDVEGEQLGHVLVRYGFIPQATLQRLIPVVLRERRRLGSLLEENGVLEKSRVDEAVGLHVRDLLFMVLDRSDGSFAFEETAADAVPVVGQEARIVPGQIILEAARRLQAPEVMAKVLGDLDRPLTLTKHPRLGVQKLTLSPTDGFLLSRTDGTLTAREMFQLIPLPEEDTERSLFALLCTGMVEYREKPGPLRGARPPAESERPAPPAAAPPPPPPPPIPTRAVPPPPTETPAIVWDLQEGATPPPPPPPPSDERMEGARQAVRAAQRLIAERKLQDAIDLLDPAIATLQGADRHWGRVTLARVYAKVPAWVSRAEETLLSVIHESPDFAEAHVVLGEVYLGMRQRARAIASFRRALEADPENAEAAAQLDAMGASPATG
jgi:hypothetical protein